MVSFVVFFILFLGPVVGGQWVDPHDMDNPNFDRRNNRESLEPHELSFPIQHKRIIKPIQGEKIYGLEDDKHNCESDLYFRRIVRLILNNAHLDKSLETEYIGHLNIRLSKRDYDFLMDFSVKDINIKGVFSEVSSIFEVAFEKSSINKYKEIIISIEEALFNIIFNPTTGALAAASLILYIIYQLLRANFSCWYIIKYLFFLMYVSDYAIVYLSILQKEEIESMVKLKKIGNVAPECDPNKMSVFTYIITHFVYSETPCKEYYEAILPNKMQYLVAPTKVLTWQFRELIIQPIGDLGEAFGKFAKAMFTALPWGWNIAIFPIMMLTTCAILFMAFLFISRGHFKLSVFHIFTIEVGRNNSERPPQIYGNRSNTNLGGTGYVANHRELIQEIANDESPDCKEDNCESELVTTDETCHPKREDNFNEPTSA